MKIAIAGTGYVGLSIAVLLAQHNEVVALDVVRDKVEKIRGRHTKVQISSLLQHLLITTLPPNTLIRRQLRPLFITLWRLNHVR